MGTGVNMLVSELTQGFERARELEAQLSRPSIEPCQSLVQEILASFEKAVSMAKSSGCPNLGAFSGTDSPRSFTGSPRSENPEQPFRVARKEMVCKKRRTQPKCTRQVKLGSGPDAEGPLDDGCSWRKYGQKEILGAKHPRGYYRCSHRNSQGCLAMRQVQQSDDNPAIFKVTYHGTHTCRQKPVQSAAAGSSFPNLDHHNNQLMLFSFQTNYLKVETENLDPQFQDPAASPSFSFSSTPIDGLKPDSHVFSPASTLDNCFKRSYADAFISPATSESNYFSRSPCTMINYGGAPSLQASESDFTEIVSAETSVSPSSMLDPDFLLQWSELDAEIPLFDPSTFFA